MLLTMCTREAADNESVEQLVSLKKTGEKKYEEFIRRAFISEDNSFWQPITKNILDIFGKSRRGQQQSYTSTTFAKSDASLLQKIFLSCYTRGEEALKTFFKHETDSLPFSLCCNGSIRSTAKSAFLPILESFGETALNSPPACELYVIDGSALIQILRPSRHGQTFGEYVSEVVVSYVKGKASKHQRVDIVFDDYFKNSIIRLKLNQVP